jgi:hypothetical protein
MREIDYDFFILRRPLGQKQELKLPDPPNASNDSSVTVVENGPPLYCVSLSLTREDSTNQMYFIKIYFF